MSLVIAASENYEAGCFDAVDQSMVLGDSGPRHQKTVAYLDKAEAGRIIADGAVVTALVQANQHGFTEIVALFS